MSERPQVVLLNPDPLEAAAWERALGTSVKVRVVNDEQGLSQALATLPADVLVAPCDAALLEVVQRWRTYARLVLCGATLPEGVLDAAGEGTDLRQVAGPEQLRRAVLALARPRSPMARQQIGGLTLSFAGLERTEVLDLSNRGLSFRLELDQPLESFLPGTQVQGLCVRRGDETVLEAEAAQVRYVEQAHDVAGAPFYKVGCELLPPRAEGGRTQAQRLDDTATCTGLLRMALRKGGILLQPADDDLDGQVCERGEVDLAAGLLRREVAAHGFEAHDVVRGMFELGGSSYRFFASVVQTEPLCLKLPPAIEANHRRAAARHRPIAARPITVRLRAPLWSPGASQAKRTNGTRGANGPDAELEKPALELEKPALEISATGLSLAIDAARDLLPPGSKLSAIDLDLGQGQDHRLRCQGEVRNLSPIPGSPGLLRCGIVFTGLSAEGRSALADALMRHRLPGLADASEFPFDDLWRFLEETGFLYPDKMETLAPLLPRVRETFSHLSKQTGHLFKAVVFHEDRRLYAHISAVRSHSRSFVVQHLAALPRLKSGQGPRAVNLGITEFLAQDQHLDFGKSYFRPDNKWPARVFGGYARRVTDRQRSDLRMHDYLVYPTTLELPETPGLRVIEARGRDLSVVEASFVASERGCILRSDDLTRATLELGLVDAAYQPAGLFRRRVVLLALRRDQPVGFALCEISSPGLNLSELLSSMQVKLLPAALEADPPIAQQVRHALMREAFSLYARAERPFVPLLKAPGEPEPAPGFEPLERKQYACWTWHRSLLRPFNEYVDRMYELLEATLARRSQRHERRARAAELPPADAPSEQ